MAATIIKSNVLTAHEKIYAAYLNALPDVGLFPVSVTNIQPDSTGNIALNVNLIPNGVALVELTSLGGNTSVADKPVMPMETVQVYPNPSNGKFNFVIVNSSGQSQIEIYNVLGEKVSQSPISTPKSEIDLSTQP